MKKINNQNEAPTITNLISVDDFKEIIKKAKRFDNLTNYFYYLKKGDNGWCTNTFPSKEVMNMYNIELLDSEMEIFGLIEAYAKNKPLAKQLFDILNEKN